MAMFELLILQFLKSELICDISFTVYCVFVLGVCLFDIVLIV